MNLSSYFVILVYVDTHFQMTLLITNYRYAYSCEVSSVFCLRSASEGSVN